MTKPEKIKHVLQKITEEAKSLNTSCKEVGVPITTFLHWVEKDVKLEEKYARAVKLRQEFLADQILEIADKQGADVVTRRDGSTYINHNVVQRNKLQVDARKWILAKMNPRKYGDKVDVTSDGEKINPIPAIQWAKPDDGSEATS